MTLAEKLAQLGCVWSTQLAEDDAFSERKARELLATGPDRSRASAPRRASGRRSPPPSRTASSASSWRRRASASRRSCTRRAPPASARATPTSSPRRSGSPPDLRARPRRAHGPRDPRADARGGRAPHAGAGARRDARPALGPHARRPTASARTSPRASAWPTCAACRATTSPRASPRPASTSSATVRPRAASTTRPRTSVRASCARCSPRPSAPRSARRASPRVMNSYAEIDGLPCGGSREILDDLLRGELGFDGLVVADYFTTRPPDLPPPRRRGQGRGRAARARGRARRGAPRPRLLRRPAPRAHRERPAARSPSSTARLRRVLRLKLELGLFERPFVDEAAAAAPYQTPDDARARPRDRREVDRAAAQRGRPAAARARAAAHRRHRPRRRRRAPPPGRLQLPRPRRDRLRAPAGPERHPAARGRPRPSRRGPTFRRWCHCSKGFARRSPRAPRWSTHRAARSRGEDRSGFGAAAAALRGAGCRDRRRRRKVRAARRLHERRVPRRRRARADRRAADPRRDGGRDGHADGRGARERPPPRAALDRRARAGGRRGLAARARRAVTPSPTCCSARTNPAGRLPITLPRAVGQVPIYYTHKSGGGRSPDARRLQRPSGVAALPVRPRAVLHALRVRSARDRARRGVAVRRGCACPSS